ncbi:hypothetical protein DRN73_01010 [Candidatus Pacearchaeota archaeon]|nr:MAG: hypothetical protein DRN73_01010 [Candidatus Pacearchaeota archaeon]
MNILNNQSLIKFAICPHETRENIDFWEKFSKKLSSFLKKEVKIVTFKDLEEEEKKIEKEKFDLYYARLPITLKLYSKGYKYLGYFKDKKNKLIIIKHSSLYPEAIFLKKQLKIAILEEEDYFFPLLNLNIDLSKTEIFFVKDHDEILKLVKFQNVDLGIVNEEFFLKKSEDDKKNISILATFEFPFYHFFMVSSIYEPLMKKIFQNFSEIELIKNQEEIFEKLTEKLVYISQNFKYRALAFILLEKLPIAIATGKEEFEFINSFFSALTGYKFKDLKNIKIDEFFIPKNKYHLIITKDGKELWIEYQKIPAQFMGESTYLHYFIDRSQQKKLEIFYEIIKEINSIITKAFLEEEIFFSVIKSLVEKFGFPLAWIETRDPENPELFVIKFKAGEKKEIIEKFKTLREKYLKLFIIEALKNQNILIIPKISESKICESCELRSFCKELFLKEGINSICAIPLMKNNELSAIIFICSKKTEYFDEEILDLLSEIKNSIEFALKSLEEFRNSYIIGEAINHSDFWVLITDEKGKIIYANEVVSKISGYSLEEIIGNTPKIFKSEYQEKDFYERMWETLNSGQIFKDVFINQKKNGEIFYLDQKIIPITLPGNIKRYIGVGRDISVEVTLLETLKTVKTRDPLTGLYNLQGIIEEVSNIMKISDMEMLFCLVEILEMNILIGLYDKETRNEIFKQIAQFFKDKFPGALIGRISPDTFLLIFIGIKKAEILRIIQTIIKYFATPLKVRDKSIRVSINIGVSYYPDDGTEPEDLIFKANLALNSAKEEGPNRFKHYSKELEALAQRTLEVEALIERALEENLFVFYYQPYFRTQDLSIAGMEALVRIVEKDGTIIPPSSFVEQLETSKFMKDFGEWALNEALKTAEKYNIPVSINFNPELFFDIDFWLSHKNKLKKIKIPLIIEITERGLIKNLEKAPRFIHSLKDEFPHIKIAIDDFGTGEANLSYLEYMPVDILKIDTIFIKEIIEGAKKIAIVDAIIRVGKALSIETLAEGVETEKHYQILKSLKCDMVQGFYLAKPQNPQELEAFLKKYTL